ncbi:MAG TPA: hypothetical protein VGI50_01880 [Solirubrobacteraceae bacterium]
MDASSYALVHGLRSTRGALVEWRGQPWLVLRAWLGWSLAVAVGLLGAIWVIAALSNPHGSVLLNQPPFVVGDVGDVPRILGHNLLVLALHAMACVAGFIAGSSLPLQAEHHRGLMRQIHERGRPAAMTFVICATCGSLSLQAHVLGKGVAEVAATVHRPPGLVLVALLPHALPELIALFLPLAAWIVAGRRGQWDRLLAATLVTVACAVPILVLASLWEVYAAPHVLGAVLGYR